MRNETPARLEIFRFMKGRGFIPHTAIFQLVTRPMWLPDGFVEDDKAEEDITLAILKKAESEGLVRSQVSEDRGAQGENFNLQFELTSLGLSELEVLERYAEASTDPNFSENEGEVTFPGTTDYQAAMLELERLESGFAPAAGRIVTFGDNLPLKAEFIQNLEEAEKIIHSSNILDHKERHRFIDGLKYLRDRLYEDNSFTVQTFRFFVWDRLKSIVESGIEHAYNAVIIAILIKLGSIVTSFI